MTRALLLALALAALPAAAQAHTFGFSHEAQVGGYFIDIGYSTDAPVPGEPVVFDFNLPDAHRDVAYSDVWVRIDSQEGAVVLATGVHNARFGGPRLSYGFPEPGTYTVFARYENGSESLVETSFPITVVPAESGLPLLPAGAFALGVAAGAAALFLPRRMRVVQ